MKKKTIPLLLLLVAALSGCALDASTEPVAAGTQPVYRTGSNIAESRTAVTSDGVATMSGDQAERALRGNPQMPAPLPGSR